MTIWQVTNGYMGNGEITALVEAEDEAAAIKLARLAFKKEAETYPRTHSSNFYETELKASVLEIPCVVELS